MTYWTEAGARKDPGLGPRAKPEQLLEDWLFILSWEHWLLRTSALLGVPRDGGHCLFIHAFTRTSVYLVTCQTLIENFSALVTVLCILCIAPMSIIRHNCL